MTRSPSASASEAPAWGLVSAALAPTLLIGGWTVAAAVQPRPFSSVRDTISQLAAVGMPHRWVMTLALAGLGLCHIVTAAALRPAATPGRAVLAVGGVATALVATSPLPSLGGSTTHTAAAALAFVGLSLWPASATATSARRDVLSRPVCLTAAAVLAALVVWLFAALQSGSPLTGLAERVAAGAQSLWPLVVMVGVRRRVDAHH